MTFSSFSLSSLASASALELRELELESGVQVRFSLLPFPATQVQELRMKWDKIRWARTRLAGVEAHLNWARSDRISNRKRQYARKGSV